MEDITKQPLTIKYNNMPARFINVSNSGQARFTNVSNSGRAVFGVSTDTTTTTTTVAQAAINIYATQIAPTASIDFHYSTDNGSTWNFVGTSVGTSCTNVATLTVPQGTSLVLRAGSSADINGVYSSTRANATSSCPAWNTDFDACTWPTLTNVPTRDVAFTINQEQSATC
jgi:hypothetical protein